MNPRRPTPSGPEPDPFDQARAPPPYVSWCLPGLIKVLSFTLDFSFLDVGGFADG